MWRAMGMGALLLGTAALVGCGPSGSAGAAPKSDAASGPPQEITVKGTNTLQFEPAQLTAKANAPIRVTLDDTGSALVHDFVIDNVGGQKVQIKAQPSAKASGQFTAQPGTYQFYCSEPGHREAGMVGTLVVS
jgi:nitrite reductase (NO-forming)